MSSTNLDNAESALSATGNDLSKLVLDKASRLVGINNIDIIPGELAELRSLLGQLESVTESRRVLLKQIRALDERKSILTEYTIL